MPTKVLQLINSFHTGGAELMAKRLALGFDRARIHSDLWSICPGPSLRSEEVFRADLAGSGISYACLGKNPRQKDPRAVFRLAREIRRGRYDIVHMHCESPGMYGRLAATLVPGTRRMITIHNHMPPSSVRMEKLMKVITDLYVACSTEIVADLEVRCGFEKSRFIRILNGIGEDRTLGVPESREALRERFGVAPGEHAALMLARLEPVKAHLDVLETLKKGGEHVSRLHVWMVGNDRADPEHAARVERAIHEQGLESRVKILGVVADGEVNALMKAADLFLLPSEREGQSVAILEALAARLPTVISDLETNREVTDDGRVAWLVPPHAPDALANVLEGVLANPVASKSRAASAAEFVQRKFGFARVIEEYSRAYENLVR